MITSSSPAFLLAQLRLTRRQCEAAEEELADVRRHLAQKTQVLCREHRAPGAVRNSGGGERATNDPKSHVHA